MNIGIPVIEDKGLQSPVSGHFGSAPFFAIVNPDTGACRVIPNRDCHHSHGACHPLASLAGEGVDSVAVSGIGAGALNKLQAGNIRVFLSEQPTAGDTLSAFKAGTLREATPDTACAHHGHGHGECHMGA